MSVNKYSRIYVAGHAGLIGSAILRRLSDHGFENILACDKAELDLTRQDLVEDFFRKQKPDVVINAAGVVGGIQANLNSPADMVLINSSITTNMFGACLRFPVKKMIVFGSSCMYPRVCHQPMKETELLNGPPESTSLSYAVSKILGVQMARAFNEQYGGEKFIAVIPNSTYGPNDDFNIETAHVLSALLARFHGAKVRGEQEIELWGTGEPRREFIYSDDVADACIRLLFAEHRLACPINIGVGKDKSVAELANMIASVVGFTGRIVWNSEKPDGAPRKLLDSSIIRRTGWRPHVSLEVGLARTYEWALDRGVLLS